MTEGAFTLRRALEKLLGPTLLACLLHLRPMEWPIMTAHFLLGTLMAVGLKLDWKALVLAWFLFVVLTNGGTLAINSAFDQDEGDIGYLKAPPKPPKRLFELSLVMLVASLGLGFLLPPVFAWANAACVLMSVLYSVPPIRLKARAGWDLIINMIGFGALTPLAGWGLTHAPVTPAFWAVAGGFGLLFGGFYPMTQIYQVEEDTARGDKTLVIRLGIGKSLSLALVFILLAHGAFAWALWSHQGLLWPLLISLAAWLAVTLPWLLRWRNWSMARHEKGMYFALWAWALTDIMLAALLWPKIQ